MLCFALRVSEKPSWAGVAFGGMACWATSASVALAEQGFPLTKHSFILKTAPRFLPRVWWLALVLAGLASGGAACADAGRPQVGSRSFGVSVSHSDSEAGGLEAGRSVAGQPDSRNTGGRRPEVGSRTSGAPDDASHRGRIAGWGIDACLTVHVEPVSLPEWVALLRESNVRWLRERNVFTGEGFDAGIRGRMEFLRAEGFELVAFAGTPDSVSAQRAGNQLPEDLLAVYASGFRQGREYAGLVSAWELTGEPDVGYCRDLPDRLAAYNKAMYLGLKSGSRSAGRSEDEGRKPGGRKAGLPDSRIAGSPHRDPIVLMGALALPPGPWWERAVDNGLLDYTDAYNFHFYGNAEDLTSVIGAHREAMSVAPTAGRGWEWDRKPDQRSGLHLTGRPAERSGYQGAGISAGSSQLSALNPQLRLPLWLTECGVSATVPGDFLSAERREFQAEFTRSTARQALAARDVAVFMPFILAHQDDPHAMTLPTPPTPLPAWAAYAKLTRETEWPRRVLSAPAGERANPVVVQWMPAEGTASHKVAGTYRVGANEVMTGEFRVYNFGDREVSGVLGAGTPEAGDRTAGSRRADSRTLRNPVAGAPETGLRFFTAGGRTERVVLSVPAGGCVTVPAIYTPGADTGYFREWLKAEFAEARGDSEVGGRRPEAGKWTGGGRLTDSRSAGASRVVFGVERQPEEADFTREPVAVYPLRGDGRLRPPEVNEEGPRFGPWRVFNGLVGGERPEARGEGLEPGGRRPEVGETEAGQPEYRAAGTRFSVAKAVNDPLAPTYALAAIKGVPEGARFLRVRLDRPMTRNAAVRVDLVDADGERFTIWENLGNPYGGSSREVWLGLEDFHPYFWSKAVAGNRRLRPDKVREIGLRFYLLAGGSMDVELEWMRARSDSEAGKPVVGGR